MKRWTNPLLLLIVVLAFLASLGRSAHTVLANDPNEPYPGPTARATDDPAYPPPQVSATATEGPIATAIQPTQVVTQVPRPTITPTPTSTFTPTPLVPRAPDGVEMKSCGYLGSPSATVRQAAQAAWQNYKEVYGYGLRCNPNIPYHILYNPYKTTLELLNPNVAYNARTNPFRWKCGCAARAKLNPIDDSKPRPRANAAGKSAKPAPKVGKQAPR